MINVFPIEVLKKSTEVNSKYFNYCFPLIVVGGILFLGGLGNLNIEIISCSLLLFGLVIIICVSIKYVSFDPINQELNIYKDYKLFKKDNKIKISEISSLKITYFIDKVQRMNMKVGRFHSTQYKTFDVFLVTKRNKDILLCSFDTYELAEKFQDLISTKTGITQIDKPERIFN